MRYTSIASAAAVCLFSGLIVPGFAQHDEKQEKQGAKPEQRAQPAQQQRAPQAQQQPQHAQQAPPQQRTPAPRQEPKAQPQQRAQQPQPQQRAPQAQQQQRAPQPQQRVQQTPQPQRAQQAPPQQRTQAPQQRAQQAPQQQQRQQPAAQQRTVLSQQQQPQRSKQQAQSWQQQRGWLKQGGGWQGHDTFQQDGSRNWAADHRSWAQRGGYGGYYIPQNSFNLYFGDQHFFRLGALPVMYLGYPRFEYEGTSFLLLDPWPETWSQDWYASDDVYIDYDNGYYLYDRNYPQQRLAITILV